LLPRCDDLIVTIPSCLPQPSFAQPKRENQHKGWAAEESCTSSIPLHLPNSSPPGSATWPEILDLSHPSPPHPLPWISQASIALSTATPRPKNPSTQMTTQADLPPSPSPSPVAVAIPSNGDPSPPPINSPSWSPPRPPSVAALIFYSSGFCRTLPRGILLLWHGNGT